MTAQRSPLSPNFPLAEADLCVKCGLCLPHCPTYLDQQHEGDSPRGRISLMQGLATGLIPLTSSLERHLDGCLSCRACEPVCPAKVPYGKLLDAGRAALAQQRPARTRQDRLIAFFLTRRLPRTALKWLLRVYQHSGIQAWARRLKLFGSGGLARLESLLPTPLVSSQRKPEPSMVGVLPFKQKIMLFTGCAGELFDQQTLNDTQSLLARLGFKVDIPVAQTCCGAIHQHAGEHQQAAELAQKNMAAFSGTLPVLCSASGCGASLLDYPVTLPGADSRQFSLRVRDINSFLLQHWPEDLQLTPLPQRIAVHAPCTLKNVLGRADDVNALLKKIPGAEIVELDATQHCCGAAGTYFMTQTEMADRLLQRKLDAADALKPALIVSANIGCSLHLAAGLRRQGITAPVMHPVSLLARQLAPQPAHQFVRTAG